MKNVLWFFGALFIDSLVTVLLGLVSGGIFFGIGYLIRFAEIMDLTYVVMILYLLFCNVFYVSIGYRILKIRYIGNKYLILLSNLILLAAWFGAFKNITVLQILGIIDLICLFIPKINQRLTNYLLKISIAPKEPATAAAAENTESGN